MIPQIDKVMNRAACFQAPIVDALSEVAFVGSGLVGLYGVYLLATGKQTEGATWIVPGIIGLFTTSYTKEISQSVYNSCKV